MGYYWLRMMDTAAAKLADKTLPQSEVDFYSSKVSQWAGKKKKNTKECFER